MKELKQIVETYDRAVAEGKRAALATVVKVEGSSYRQPGARMLVTEDGNLTGAISGGCLEGDAMRKALLVIARNKPMVFTYDTSDENSGFLAVGLGCNGIVHILFEPLESGKPNSIDLIRRLLMERNRNVLLTLFSITEPDAPAATCLSLNEQNQVSGSLPEGLPSDVVMQAGRDALAQGNSLIRNFRTDPEWSVLADLVIPPLSLIIAGAGNDVMPVVSMADVLGWQTTVLDGRPSYANCRRFPEAAQVVVADALHALAGLVLDDRTAVLLMTHNYQYDLALLEQLIDSNVAYIGILGPKSKTKRLIADLPEVKRLQSCLGKVYGPAGLDLGAETSDEIALSILSEVKAVLAGKNGSQLRIKDAPIHQPTHEDSVALSTHKRIIILAAGSSERMGQPKQLLPYHGQSLIMQAVQEAGKAMKEPPVVVTGGYDKMIRNELKDLLADIVFNPEWQTGMASSIRAGLRHVMKDPDIEDVIIAVTDQPFVTAELFSSLFSHGQHSSKPIMACRYADGTVGTPVCFKKVLFGSLLDLEGTEGARKIIRNHPDLVETVDFPMGGIDIDTMEDYKNLMIQDGISERSVQGG